MQGASAFVYVYKSQPPSRRSAKALGTTCERRRQIETEELRRLASDRDLTTLA
jgi:hypothetical protein